MSRLESIHGSTRHLVLALALFGSMIATPASAGVTINIGQPGFYGRLDIGGFPPPALLYPQPTVIYQPPAVMEPLYLRVPPWHARHWRSYCQRYGACGVPVYFVRDDWYEQRYVPLYRERYGREWRHEREDYRDEHHHHHGHRD